MKPIIYYTPNNRIIKVNNCIFIIFSTGAVVAGIIVLIIIITIVIIITLAVYMAQKHTGKATITTTPGKDPING